LSFPTFGIICLVCRPRPSTGGVHRAAGTALRSENEHYVILVTAQPPPRGKLRLSKRDTPMKNAFILIAFALAIIAGTAAEAVETHQAVLYATTNH